MNCSMGFDSSEMIFENRSSEERVAQSDPSFLRRRGKQHGPAINDKTPNSRPLICALGGSNFIGEAAGKVLDLLSLRSSPADLLFIYYDIYSLNCMRIGNEAHLMNVTLTSSQATCWTFGILDLPLHKRKHLDFFFNSSVYL